MTDFVVTGRSGDTVFLVTPRNPEATAHLEQHVEAEVQWLGNSLAVEHRYIEDLMAELCNAGFSVEFQGVVWVAPEEE